MSDCFSHTEQTIPAGWRDPSGNRHAKTHKTGLTMVIDKGTGLSAFRDTLELAASYFDICKLGFGTTALYPPDILQRKVQLAKAYGLHIMPGGTFFEIARRKIDDVAPYMDVIAQLGFNAVEISDGTFPLTARQRKEAIVAGVEAGLIVYTEFGKKEAHYRIQRDELLETLYMDLEAGASHVIVEARESGTVGVFNQEGAIDHSFVLDIVDTAEKHHDRLIWEAPQKEQQVSLIKALGSHVHLGNIAYTDILSVETLRRGLRGDTAAILEKRSSALCE